jgi:DNA-binding response OmpR family regulator
VQESYPDLLVIVLTAFATLESAIAAVKVGASDYLLKPVSMRDVEAAVSQALERRRESLRQQHLIGVIAQAVDALQSEPDPEAVVSSPAAGRFLQADQLVRPHISRLRGKIEQNPSEPQIIRTVVGKGYLFSAGQPPRPAVYGFRWR